jgi:Animal haem peroxidase
LETRRKCGFKWDFKSFEGLLEIFPQSYVDLLSNAYESVEDIDLIVGGVLETFLNGNNSLAGETLGCTIHDQYQRTMGGDAYFFSHPSNPHPFTAPQIAAIKAFRFNNLFCGNSGIGAVSPIGSLLTILFSIQNFLAYTSLIWT